MRSAAAAAQQCRQLLLQLGFAPSAVALILLECAALPADQLLLQLQLFSSCCIGWDAREGAVSHRGGKEDKSHDQTKRTGKLN